MSKTLKQMTGEEFAKKILAGERDFSWIELEPDFDFNRDRIRRYISGIELEPSFDSTRGEIITQINDYLRGQDLRENPINISNSKLIGIQAHRLYLPFLYGLCADIRNANLCNANLDNANLDNANLWYANLEHAELRGVNLHNANLCNANLEYAELWHTDFCQANFKNIRNLEKAINLGMATFLETRVTQKEKEVIEEVLKERKMFVVKAEN